MPTMNLWIPKTVSGAMVWRLLPIAAIGWMGCHDNPRENPFDPTSTPAVEIHTVVVDSLQGTAALTWSQYAGGQPFGEYRVVRRLIGQIQTETRGIITEVGDTTFVDSDLEADRTYSYEILVVNSGGGEARSEAIVATSAFVAPQIRSLEFDSITASATLAWDRAQSGFSQYNILRQGQDDAGPEIVHRTTDIDETSFVDSGLEGNTNYTYMVETRSATGKQLSSAPQSGAFHKLIRQWQWTPPTGVAMKAAAVDPSGQLYASFGTALNIFAPAPFETPDELYLFSPSGDLISQFPSEAVGAPGFFGATALAADEAGVYVLLKEPFSPLPPPPPGAKQLASGKKAQDPNTEDMEVYLNAFDPSGSLRYRWPSEGTLPNLANVEVSTTSRLWVSQASRDTVKSVEVLTLYELDANSGVLLDTYQLEGVFIIPYFGANMDSNEDFLLIRGISGGESNIVFDVARRRLLPIALSAEIQSDVADVALGNHAAYFMFDNPPRVEVLRDWKRVTTIPVRQTSVFPQWIGVDSAGKIQVATADLSVLLFAP